MTCNLTTPAPDEAPASLMALPDELLRKVASFSQLFASAPALVVAIGRNGGAAVKEEHRNMARKSAAKLFPRGVVASLEQAKRDVARDAASWHVFDTVHHCVEIKSSTRLLP